MIDEITTKLNSAVASQLYPSGHITADKRLRYASPKFAIANFTYPHTVRRNC